MAEYQFIRLSVFPERHVARLTLNRPERKNALSRAMLSEIVDALTKVRDDPGCRCLILDAAGDTFCAGLDLYDLREENRTQPLWDWEGEGTPVKALRIMRKMPQVTVAAVQGYCLGGGLVLVNGCDLAVAAEDAKIGMPEVIRGSYGAVATPTLFLSRVPVKKAFYIQLTGRNMSGAKAERIGLVSECVPAAELASFVDELADEIGTRDPVTLHHAKIAGYVEMELGFDQALRADEAIYHRQRFYTNPLDDVEAYLHSQKSGTNRGYAKTEKS